MPNRVGLRGAENRKRRKLDSRCNSFEHAGPTEERPRIEGCRDNIVEGRRDRGLQFRPCKVMVPGHYVRGRPKPFQPRPKLRLSLRSTPPIVVYGRVKNNEDTTRAQHSGDLRYHLFKICGIVEGGVADYHIHGFIAEGRALEFPPNSLEVWTCPKKDLRGSKS